MYRLGLSEHGFTPNSCPEKSGPVHGEDLAILAARHTLYTSARDLKPARWSGKTRNWTPVGAVTRNPERDCIVKAHSENSPIQPLAA
jgi:hypothetical protein